MVQMAKAHCSLASFEQEQLVKKLLEQVVVFTELTCDALNKRSISTAEHDDRLKTNIIL